MSDHPILFIPGPVEVEAELREVMSTPIVGHRTPAFKEVVRDVSGRLQKLFLSDGPAFFDNCAATAMMEAGIRNLVRERVLHMTCGAFGERWAQVSALCGRSPETVSLAWGEAVTPALLRKTLEESPSFEAVCFTHSETSTGVLNPLEELAATVRDVSPDTLILVDAVSSFGGAELRFAEWGLDLVFAGIQKALALPPGLTVFALSDRAVERARRIESRGFVIDFAAAPERFGKGLTPATPCVPLVLALQRQLERIEAEGVENRWQRHLDMQAYTEEWAERTGMELFVPPGYRSPTVTTVKFSDRDPDELIARAGVAGFTLAMGYGKIKEETFRIGHMGDHTVDRLKELLEAIS